jgi:hypothetical protein
MAYRDEFIQAAKRTESFKLPFEDFYLDSTLRLLDANNPTILTEAIKVALGNPTDEELIGNCLDVTRHLVRPISELFGVDAIYTLGWLDMGDGERWFEFDDQYIDKSIQEGHVAGSKKPIHAWLTLPNMEIIDATLGSSLSKIYNQPHFMQQVIARYADTLDRIRFKPMLIGTGFLEIEAKGVAPG